MCVANESVDEYSVSTSLAPPWLNHVPSVEARYEVPAVRFATVFTPAEVFAGTTRFSTCAPLRVRFHPERGWLFPPTLHIVTSEVSTTSGSSSALIARQ